MALYDVSKEDLLFDPACLGDNLDDDGNYLKFSFFL
jgi:hypothetical protein